MLNEVVLLQILLISTLLFFNNTINIISLWYLAGIYLLGFGFLLLLDDGNIFVGFLWVIDLGVGLIFFIFILHFSHFLHQKSYIQLTARTAILSTFFIFFLITFFFFFSFTTSNNSAFLLEKNWFFFLSWYDYYEIYAMRIISELSILREIYYYSNSLAFFIINFMLFFGIYSAITLTFAIKRVFSFMYLSQIKNFNLLSVSGVNFFIRNQNFIKQQNTSTGTRVWVKLKKTNLRDL